MRLRQNKSIILRKAAPIRETGVGVQSTKLRTGDFLVAVCKG